MGPQSRLGPFCLFGLLLLCLLFSRCSWRISDWLKIFEAERMILILKKRTRAWGQPQNYKKTRLLFVTAFFPLLFSIVFFQSYPTFTCFWDKTFYCFFYCSQDPSPHDAPSASLWRTIAGDDKTWPAMAGNGNGGPWPCSAGLWHPGTGNGGPCQPWSAKLWPWPAMADQALPMASHPKVPPPPPTPPLPHQHHKTG